MVCRGLQEGGFSLAGSWLVRLRAGTGVVGPRGRDGGSRRLRTARERAAPPRGQPPIFSSCEEEKTGRWAVQKRRTGGAYETVRRRPGGLCRVRRSLEEQRGCFPAFVGAVLLSGWLSYGLCSSFRAPVATWSRKACGKPPALRSLLLPLLALPFSATGGGRARPPASLSATWEIDGAAAERGAGQIRFAPRYTETVRRGVCGCKLQKSRSRAQR